MSFSAKKQIHRHQLRPAPDRQVDLLCPDGGACDDEGFPVRLFKKPEICRIIRRSPKWIELRTRDSDFPSHLFRGARRFSLREIAFWWGEDWTRSWIQDTWSIEVVSVDERGFVDRPISKNELANLIRLSARWVELRTVADGLPAHSSRGQTWYHLGEVIDWADEMWGDP